MQIRYVSTTPSSPPGPLRKLAGLVIAVAVAALALMFSVALLVALAVVVLIAGTYWWWKTRELRKQLRELARHAEQMQERAQAEDEDVFEGEVIRVVEEEFQERK